LVAEIRGLVKEEFVLKVRGQRPFGGRMGSSLGSTMAAMNVAISGIADAERLHERAALDVQRSFHGPDSPSPLRPPDEGAGGQATTLTLSGQAGDLAAAMTTMMKAETYNKANVAVLKTADEMTRQLMDIVG
jgi:hypothetical protein